MPPYATPRGGGRFVTPYTPPSSVSRIKPWMLTAANAAGRLAGSALRSYISKSTQTTRSGTNRGTQTGKRAVGSRAVRVTRTAKMGRSRFRGRKVNRRGKVSKFLSGGVYRNLEVTGSTSTANCQYIGHATAPPTQLQRAFFSAVLKLLCVKLGTSPISLDNAIPGILVADKFTLVFKTDTDVASSSHSYTVAATSDTYLDVISNWATAFDDVTPSYYITHVKFEPGTTSSHLPYTLLNLQNALVAFDVVSTLKFQNRTVNETGDEDANDVDHVPLQGKYYSGKGTGTVFLNGVGANAPFVADPTGVINKEGNINVQQEPPFAQNFRHVSKKGSVVVGAGEIITSTLKWNKTMTLTTLGRMIWSGDGADESVYALIPAGMFRFYAVEKVINSGSEEIKTAWEHNYRIGCRIKPREVNNTVMYNDTS